MAFAQRIRPNIPQDSPIASEISKDIGTWCGAGTPLADGSGCEAVFYLHCGDINVSIQKEIVGFGFSEQVKQKLAGLDPTTMTEHVQFGSPFDSKDGDGTHYFCAPVNGNWECTLFVSQKI